MLRGFAALALCFLIALPCVSLAQSVAWDLTDLYPTPDAWTASYEKTTAAAARLEDFKGRLGTDSATLLAALDAVSTVRKENSRLWIYALLRSDEDKRVASEQERYQQSLALDTLVNEKTSWLAPDIIRLGAAKVAAFQKERGELAGRHRFYLTDTLRSASHTLGDEAETLLAAAGTALAQPYEIYGQLANAELPWPELRLAGETVLLDQSAYEKYRRVADRATRKQLFDTFWGTWKKLEGSLGAVLVTRVIGDTFHARARKFDNGLDEALFAENIPQEVYRTLIAEANAALPTLHRYLKLRKARLGIAGEMAYYDNYAPLVVLPKPHEFTVSESQTLTLAAVAPLGPEYVAQLRKGFAGRWMDALPRPGKAAGGYQISAYDVHPYVLLNHNDDYESLSAIAHEWGHVGHSLLANSRQPFETADASLLVAETASIGNEMLLNDYLIAHAGSRVEKLYYLVEGLESIRATFFRQVMFAEFELAMHEAIEKGEPLSGARLSDMYCGIAKRYFGEAQGVVRIDPAYCIEWAYVTHFYDGFYVWKYATAMAGAAAMTDAILQQRTGQRAAARERFLNLLRAGGSDYPHDLYRAAGIDMTKPAPYRALMARMNRLMDEFEALEKAR